MATDIRIIKGRYRASILAMSDVGIAWMMNEMDLGLSILQAGAATVSVELADELAQDIRKEGLDVEVS